MSEAVLANYVCLNDLVLKFREDPLLFISNNLTAVSPFSLRVVYFRTLRVQLQN
jgi:hypothetical protein